MDTVMDIMAKPICCSQATKLEDVAKMMRDHDCGSIPVLDQDNKPVGIVTDRDIVCRVVAEGKNPLKMSAADCMSSPCVTIQPETSMHECCETMKSNQIRRVVVVDEQGECCGILAQADIALNTSHDEAAEVVQEISRAA